MSKFRWIIAAMIGALFIAVSDPGAAFSQSLVVKGPDGKSRIIAQAEMSAMPRIRLNITQHDQRRVFDGVALSSLLELVGAPLGKALRGRELADIVLVTASDGYQVVLALAEADPAMQTKQVILADRMDDRPLPPDHGPFQLIVEGDTRPARAVRMVQSIELMSIGKDGYRRP